MRCLNLVGKPCDGVRARTVPAGRLARSGEQWVVSVATVRTLEVRHVRNDPGSESGDRRLPRRILGNFAQVSAGSPVRVAVLMIDLDRAGWHAPGLCGGIMFPLSSRVSRRGYRWDCLFRLAGNACSDSRDWFQLQAAD
jgi:hypothetical protein